MCETLYPQGDERIKGVNDMGVFDKLKDVGEKVGDKMDDIITGKDEAEKAADKVEDAVEDGKEKISEAIKALDLDNLDMDGLQNLLKGKESDLDSVAADIGKKVLASDTSKGSFDLSSIKDLLSKANEIKEIISAISSKIGALKG